MTAETTAQSAAVAGTDGPAHPEPLRTAPGDVRRDFARFLRAPRLLAPSGLRSLTAWKLWGLLTLLELVVLLAVVLPLMQGWQKAFGLPAPTEFDKISKTWLPVIAVLLAPALEELAFRSWQSGRPRALVGIVGVLLGIALVTLLVPVLGPIPRLGIALAVLAATAAIAFALRRRPAPRWFAAAFPAIFYLAALGFAVLHLTNYPRISALLVPMVLPQFWAALVLGYERQRLGLVAAILTHLVSNAATLALVMLMPG